MVSAAKLRAWWAHRQGLDGRLDGQSAREVLGETGWARSVGGAGPYLGCFARSGVSRAAMDKALQRAEIHELPSARGCTYVVPNKDFALALRAGSQQGDGAMKVAQKLGVTRREIDQLADAVVGALSKSTAGLEPDALKDALGDAVRNLGDAGRKKGLTTTLPLALGRLQKAGEIRRIPTNGRLDQQRYRYARWKQNPLRGMNLTQEEVYVELARRFFAWIGPATVTEFAQFAGLGAGAGRRATDPLKLLPVEAGSERLILPDCKAAFDAFRAPREPQIVLVSSVDGLTLLRRDLGSLLEPPDGEDRLWKLLGANTFDAGSGLRDLPSHAIVDRGRIVGLWEYDPRAGRIIWAAFGKAGATMKAAVKRMEEFVREQLGDARSFSLDSPSSRVGRIAALQRRMGD